MSGSTRKSGLFNQFFGQPNAAKYSMSVLSTLCTQLAKTSVVTEKNRDVVVEQLRNLTEQLVWGYRNDPAFFEYFLEKNVLAIFWRFLAQPRSPVTVKVQLLQTLAILLHNIEAGPSVCRPARLPSPARLLGWPSDTTVDGAFSFQVYFILSPFSFLLSPFRYTSSFRTTTSTS